VCVRLPPAHPCSVRIMQCKQGSVCIDTGSVQGLLSATSNNKETRAHVAIKLRTSTRTLYTRTVSLHCYHNMLLYLRLPTMCSVSITIMYKNHVRTAAYLTSGCFSSMFSICDGATASSRVMIKSRVRPEKNNQPYRDSMQQQPNSITC
jgi:hypothetical protein